MGHITLETPWASFFLFSALGSTSGKIVGMRQMKRPTTTMTPQDNFSRVGFFRTISNLQEKKNQQQCWWVIGRGGGGVEGEGGEGEGVEGGRRWHFTLAEHKDGTASLICSWGRSGKFYCDTRKTPKPQPRLITDECFLKGEWYFSNYIIVIFFFEEKKKEGVIFWYCETYFWSPKFPVQIDCQEIVQIKASH